MLPIFNILLGKQLPKLSTLSEHAFKDDDTVLLYISQNKQEDPQDDKNEMVKRN